MSVTETQEVGGGGGGGVGIGGGEDLYLSCTVTTRIIPAD